MPDLVLSVPEPDISLHFLSGLKTDFRTVDSTPEAVADIRGPYRKHFSNNLTDLEMLPEFRSKPSNAARLVAARIRYASITNKTKPKADSMTAGTECRRPSRPFSIRGEPRPREESLVKPNLADVAHSLDQNRGAWLGDGLKLHSGLAFVRRFAVL